MERAGIIRRKRRAIYVVGGSVADHRQDLMVAVLAGPEGCVASHESAAFLHGLAPAPSMAHVTVGREQRLRMPNVVAHRSVMVPSHRGRIGAIPTTSLHRTIVDLA
jgi:predicted transcriptional regulator of viral defense system